MEAKNIPKGMKPRKQGDHFKSQKRKMFRNERSQKSNGSFKIMETQNILEGTKPRKQGAYLKSRKRKLFRKERSLESKGLI
jgi:hypothetical protein